MQRNKQSKITSSILIQSGWIIPVGLFFGIDCNKSKGLLSNWQNVQKNRIWPIRISNFNFFNNMKTLFAFAFSLIALFGFAQKTQSYPEFEVTVTGNGPSLFLIPGATCHADVWTETVAALKNQYTCHTFTLAGYAGVPALSGDVMLPNIKQAIVEYVRQNKKQRVILMGHSIGGWLASWIAAEQSDLVDQLIIVDAIPFLAAAGNPAATEESMKAMGAQGMIQTYTTMDSATFAGMQQQMISSMVRTESERARVVNWSMTSDRRAMAITAFEMLSTDLRDEMALIQAPTLVVIAWGPEYPNDKEAHTKIFAGQYDPLKNKKVVVSDLSKHFVMIDQKDWFMQQIKGFLNDQI